MNRILVHKLTSGAVAVIVLTFCIAPSVHSHPGQEKDQIASPASDSKVVDGDDGRISIEQPPTFGAAFQAEVQRLQRLHEVFPPSEESYFSPYGDRTVVALQFPRLVESEELGGGDHPPVPPGIPASSYYGIPVYGPIPKPKPKHLKKAKDFGVIISQNYVYRRNVRDSGNFSKIFANARSSQDILQEVAKMLVISGQMRKALIKPSSGGVPNSLATLLNVQVLNGLSHGVGPPPIHPLGWDWNHGPQPKPFPSFAIMAIESRVKVSTTGTSGEELSLTNGSIIFPSPENPRRLAHVPFILRGPGDVETVFAGVEGYEEESYGGDKVKGHGKGLIPPEEKRNLISLLKLVEGVHSDSHEDGKERLKRVQKLSQSLSRLPLPKSQEFLGDPRADEDAKARETYWLYTTTIALRSLTPPPVKKLYPVVTLVPIVDSYREHPLNVIEYGVQPPPQPQPLVPVVGPHPVFLEHRQLPVLVEPQQQLPVILEPQQQLPVLVEPQQLPVILEPQQQHPVLLEHGQLPVLVEPQPHPVLVEPQPHPLLVESQQQLPVLLEPQKSFGDVFLSPQQQYHRQLLPLPQQLNLPEIHYSKLHKPLEEGGHEVREQVEESVNPYAVFPGRLPSTSRGSVVGGSRSSSYFYRTIQNK